MITLDLRHLFKTSPNSTKVPKVVSDWVLEKDKQFSDIEFKISFWDYGSEDEKKLGLKYERIYSPTLLNLRNVIFPLSRGYWNVRLIGDQELAIKASGILALLEEGKDRIEIVPFDDKTVSARGYIRINSITNEEEEMVDIRCDRNVNDEWEFRGTGQEFWDEKVNPVKE